MEPAQEHAAADRAGGLPAGPAEAETDLELLVHGVGGTTPEKMLGDPRTVRITGDHTAAVFRRAEDADAEARPEDYRGRAVPEAYVWCNLTSGNGTRALWLLLLPFMVVNLAHWMRPAARERTATARLYGLLVRLAGLTLTVLLVAAACEVALDLTAWQCAGVEACAGRHTWLGFLSPAASDDGWWSLPGRRLALAALLPTALTGLLWYLSHRTWNAYESQPPATHAPGPGDPHGQAALGSPGFWYGRRLVARLRAAHTAAGLLTVAAAVALPAARFDRRPGGPAILDTLGDLLIVALCAAAAFVVGVVCRRGRSEHRLDRELDSHLVRRLPLGALALLLLTLLYAGWSRPGWHSSGRLPGDPAFGGIALVQGALVIAVGVVAHLLHRTRGPGEAGDPPADARPAMRGLGGPAVALLACALGGVISGGVAQRVADWLDGTRASIDGPPVLLTWQASIIPPFLVALLGVVAWLSWRTWRLSRAERSRVARDHQDEPEDVSRTRRIARTRAMAALTDQAPLVIAVVAVATLLLGAGALIGAGATGETPDDATREAYAVVQGAAATSQALGSWLVGLGFILFVTWGRRAYKDASARRTIGILWDVGTFWPRAAHPFAPPCYAERAVPDLTWRMATWTRHTGGRLVLSGHSQGSVLAAAAAWQLTPSVRKRVALLTYGSPLERLYGRWFPAHFGPAALGSLHREVACWRNLYRLTDPIGGPIRLPGDCGPDVDREPLKDPLAYGRTVQHPLPAPILGHSDYQADPAFAEERERLLARLRPELPRPRTREERRPEHRGRSVATPRGRAEVTVPVVTVPPPAPLAAASGRSERLSAPELLQAAVLLLVSVVAFVVAWACTRSAVGGFQQHGTLMPSDTAQVIAAIGATGLGIGSGIAAVIKAIALLTGARADLVRAREGAGTYGPGPAEVDETEQPVPPLPDLPVGGGGPGQGLSS
ncbi:putative membrane protein [Streptomyces sp. V3I7]|nr:putative membrane protein [Streptomyces sp. V3I7]